MVLWSCAALLAAQLTVTAQTLSHQYSFWNTADSASTVVDLVGGADGTLNGDAYIAGGLLQLAGNGSVGLPPGIITNDLAVTMEAWADYPYPSSQPGNAYLFDFGQTNAAGQDSYAICVNLDYPYGDLIEQAISGFDNANVGRESCFASPIASGYFGTFGMPPAHLAAVFNPSAGYMALYINGVLVSQTKITNSITPGVKDVSNLIGRNNWGDRGIISSLYEFRIWNGALNSLQVAASCQNSYANVNTDGGTITNIQLSAGSPLYQGANEAATVVGAATLLTNTVDVTRLCTFSSDNTNILTVDATGMISGVGVGTAHVAASCAGLTNSVTVTVVPALVTAVTHRYSFHTAADNTPTAVDSAGSANGTLNGTAVITGGQLVLDGSGYVELPAGMVTNNLAVTVETWGDFPLSQGTWANLFDFGKQNASGQDSYAMGLVMKANNGQFQMHINNFDNANVSRQTCIAPNTGIAGGTNAHIVTVFNVLAGYTAIYTNGVLAKKQTGITATITPGIQDVDNWIAKNNWGDPLVVANLNEFRIWNGALSDAQVLATYQSGYASLPAFARPSLVASVSSGNIVISWPVAGSNGAALYSSPSIGTAAVWTLVGTAPTIVGQNYQVSVPMSGGQVQFYSLRQ